MKRFTSYRLLSLIFFLQILPSIFPQDGHNYLRNYTLEIGNIGKRISGISQAENGIMYYTTTRGIMTYDGSEWNVIKTPSTPLCVTSDSEKKVLYVGCDNDFGYMITNSQGYQQYMSLVNTDEQIGKITKIIVQNKLIYYYSDQAIYLYSKKSKSIKKTWRSKKKDHYKGIFSFDNKIYVNRLGTGLHKLINEKLTPVKNGMDMANCKILVSIPIDSNRIVLYTDKSEGIIYDGNKLKKQKNDIVNYIKENTITCGLNLCNGKYIIGTLTGGCMLVDKKTNKSISVINYQTGLSDDEIYSLGNDDCGGIWIAHELGLSRLDVKLPIKQYSNYPGIKGHIISSKILDNKNYIATNQGLFVLSELTVDEKIIYIKGKKRPKPTQNTTATNLTEPISPITYDNQRTNKTEDIEVEENKSKNRKLKNLFRKNKKEIKKKKEKKKKKGKDTTPLKDTYLVTPINSGGYTSQELPTANCTPCEPCVKRPTTSYYVQHSIIHGYKKITGIDDKCKDMVLFSGNILALGATTLYKVEKNKAVPIIENKLMNTIYVSNVNKNTFYVGSSKGIFAHNMQKELWSLENIYASVHSILEDDNGDLWVGCEKSVMKIEIDENGFPGRQTTYRLDIGFSEQIISRIISGNIYFFSSSNIYLYSEAYNEVIEIDNLMGIEINDYLKVIYSNDGYTWVYDGNQWVGLHEHSSSKPKVVKYYNVLNGIQYIFLDQDSKAWVIDIDNNLYKINTTKEYTYKSNSDLTIRSISSSKKDLLSMYNIELLHDHSGVKINFATAYFLNEQNIKYQYLLKGEMEEWSEWSTKSFVYFPFVPVGKYILKVRSRNVFGEISNIAEIPVRVSPPYWLTWWFYIIEISVIFFLLMLSIVLNTKKEESWISKSLMLLTVVIIFKLLQAISHTYIHTTPVMDFVISVIMVFVILKVEKLAVKGLINMCRNFKAKRLKRKKGSSKEMGYEIKSRLRDELLKYSKPKSINNN